jgi:cytochrome c556
MADLFRLVSESDKAKLKPDDFAAALKADSGRVAALEEMLAAGAKDTKKLSAQFSAIQTSCRDCHGRYRD